MSLHAYTTKGALIVALSLVLAACGKQDQPATPFPTGNGQAPLTAADCDKLADPKPADDSAAGRATAVSQGVAARAGCKKEVAAQQDKPNADLARMREIMEKQEAERSAAKQSDEQFKRGLKEGAKQPIREFKY
jgi:hypothetical protein